MKKRIFTFWEPKEKIIPYINLCLKTWKKNLLGYEIVILDHSNLCDYIDSDIYDPVLFERAGFNVQSDAISAAVLRKYGGIFMDADTIVLRDISPLIDMFESKKTELMMFYPHLAIIMAKPDSYIMNLWVKRIQKKLVELKEEKEPAHWYYSGNKIPGSYIIDLLIKRFWKKLVPWYYLGNSILNPLLLKNSEEHVCLLDKTEWGITPEVNFFKEGDDKSKKYLDFWFMNDLSLEHVFLRNSLVFVLHNSWTPEWYKKLSEKEVLEDNCLLSKTLKHVLIGKQC
ncbi:MAG: hypothetical protein GY777_12820 [Candidatus Brocadiaceae bacterium]|nr:hypothetical protein [Candidatus Brocadiaceae bacterium]